ncbi:MAG: T9SS type A sorting domain-containing protein [bacterium]|nr:T9SS type A sorting domain-containing protein [bacterium]
MKRKFTTCIIMMLVGINFCFSQTPLRVKHKKIIHMGWESPTTKFIRDSISVIKAQPFDGIGIMFKFPNHDVSICAFTPEAVTKTEIQAQIDDLNAVQFGKLTDNFLLLFTADVSTLNSFDWFNDAQWDIMLNNAKLVSEIVKDTKLKGIIFDTENYSGVNHPWVMKNKYSNIPLLRQKIRERGKQFINALENSDGKITILTTFFYGYLAKDSADDYSPLARYFFDGMLEDLNTNSKIIDGVENHYWVTNTYQFPFWTNYTKKTVLENGYVSNELKEKYKKQVGTSAGIFHNYIMGLNCNQQGIDCSNTLDTASKRKWLESSIYNGLINNDEYIWLYNQGESNWWRNFKDKQFSINAINSAKYKAINELPLGFTLENRDISKYNSKGFYIDESTTTISLNSTDSKRLYTLGDSVRFRLNSNDIYANYIRFYINGQITNQIAFAPFYYNLDTLPSGNYEVYTTGYSATGQLIQSNSVFFQIKDKTNGLKSIKSFNIKIAPNPISLSTIKFSTLTPEILNSNFTIYNYNGTKIKEGIINEDETEIPFNFSSGIYFIVLQTLSNDIISLKFLKE